MHLHDERITRPLLISHRIHQHALDRLPVGAFPFDLFLARQDEIALQRIVGVRDLRRRAAGNRHRPDVAPPRRLIELKHQHSRFRHELPSARLRRDEVPAVGQLTRAMRSDVDLDELAVHAQIDDGDDRFAVGRPRRVVDRVLEIGQQRLRRAAGRGDHEDRRVVVRLEPLVGVGEEQHLAVVGGELRRRFRNLVSRERAGVGARDVHDPHFAAEAVADERRRAALHRDLRAVAREPVLEDRRLAGRQLLFGSGRDVHFPELLRLVVLLERVDVVAQPIALAFLAGWRIAGEEIDGRAIRRPDRRRRRGGVTGEGPRFSAIGGDQLNLTGAQEQDRLAVRRPANAARRRNVAAFRERELNWRAVDVLPPQVPDRPAGLPVDFGQHVRERPPVRRKTRRQETLKLREVDEGHRDGAFARQPAGRAPTGGRPRQPRPTASDGGQSFS